MVLLRWPIKTRYRTDAVGARLVASFRIGEGINVAYRRTLLALHPLKLTARKKTRSEGSRSACAPGLAYRDGPEGSRNGPRCWLVIAILPENRSGRKGVVGRISRLYGAG